MLNWNRAICQKTFGRRQREAFSRRRRLDLAGVLLNVNYYTCEIEGEAMDCRIKIARMSLRRPPLYCTIDRDGFHGSEGKDSHI